MNRTRKLRDDDSVPIVVMDAGETWVIEVPRMDIKAFDFLKESLEFHKELICREEEAKDHIADAGKMVHPAMAAYAPVKGKDSR